jgi:hypothetical protein
LSNVTSDQYGPSPASTASSPASAPATNQSTQQIPFTRASRTASQQDFSFSAAMASGSSPQIGPMDIQTNGFLRSLELYVQAPIASGNSANVAFNENSPWHALINCSLQDPSSEYIVNPYTGYELYLAEKYFQYNGESPYCDARNDPNYEAVTGTGGTGGTFQYPIRVPLEDRKRDAFCAVPNSAANKNYRFQANLNTSGNVYTTSPTALPTVSVNATNFYWTEPPTSIGSVPTVSAPNGNGSVAYLDRETFTSLSSATTPTLIFKNVGRVYKSALFILYSTASPSVRDDTDWPDPMSIWVNGYPLYYKPKHTWYSEMADVYGLSGSTRDVAGGLDTGVYAWYDLASQPFRATNWGPADQMLATAPSTKIQLVGSFGADASNMVVLQRTIKPSSGAALYGSTPTTSSSSAASSAS